MPAAGRERKPASRGVRDPRVGPHNAGNFMSMFHHNDPNAERLALGWHILGAVISLNIMLISAACAVLLWPVAVHLLAWLCWSLVTDSIIGLGGVGWHIWAISEHMKALRAFH